MILTSIPFPLSLSEEEIVNLAGLSTDDNPVKSDAEALADDWRNVGDDLREVLGE